MSHQDDINTSLLFMFGFLGTIVVVVIILALMVLYQNTETRLQYQRQTSQPDAALDTALAEQRTRLVEYKKTGVVEQNGTTQGVYRIPIERAQELILSEWRSGALPRAAEASSEPPAGASGPDAPAAASQTAAGSAAPAAAPLSAAADGSAADGSAGTALGETGPADAAPDNGREETTHEKP